MSAILIRKIEIDDITPAEAARIFSEMFADQQAEFFAEVGRIAKEWPGAGWCMQSCSISHAITEEGRAVIETLAGHVLDAAGKARIAA